MTTDALKQANIRYKQKHCYYNLRLTQTQHEAILTASQACGQTIQQYILDAVLRRLEAEKQA